MHTAPVSLRSSHTYPRIAHGWNTASSPVGKFFTLSEHPLAAVWPGELPGLAPVHSYRCADTAPTVS